LKQFLWQADGCKIMLSTQVLFHGWRSIERYARHKTQRIILMT